MPADLYALGCVGYFLLTGTPVFTDTNPMKVALKHVQVAPGPEVPARPVGPGAGAAPPADSHVFRAMWWW